VLREGRETFRLREEAIMKLLTTLIPLSLVAAVSVIGVSVGDAYAKDKTAFAEIKGCTD
jgi:hypothetical protein